MAKAKEKAPEVVVGPHWEYLRQRGTYRGIQNEDGSATVVAPSGHVKHYESWAEVDELFYPVGPGQGTIE